MSHTNRLIVKFAPIPAGSNVTLAQWVEEIRLCLPQAEVVRGPGRSGRVVYAIDPAADVARWVDELSKRDEITYAELDVTDREA